MYNHRFFFWKGPNIFRFIDQKLIQGWKGAKHIFHYDDSYDRGKSYVKSDGQLLFAAYFFLGDEIISHNFIEESILSVIGHLGGHVHIILLFVGLVVAFINKHVLIAKLIRSNYFIRKPISKQDKKKKSADVCASDITNIKINFYNKCCRYSRDRKSRGVNKKELYTKASQQLHNEMCIFNILQVQQKLKAAVTVLLGDDVEQMMAVED